VLFGVDTLIEADGSIELALQFGVAENVIPSERLLDHHQVIGFQALEVQPILQPICGIGVDHQTDPRKLQAQPLDRYHVTSWLDLDLDALVAGSQLPFNGRDELLECLFNSDGYAAGNLPMSPAEQLPKGNALLPCLHIPDGGFHGAFGHVVSANRFESCPNFRSAFEISALQERPDEVA